MGNTLSLGISADSDDGVLARESARYRSEVQRLTTIASDLLVRKEADCGMRCLLLILLAFATGS